MITGVAFCPQAPALVPEIGRGLDAELGPLRAACRAAIRRIAAPDIPIVIIGMGDSTAGYGVDVRVPTIGEWLVHDALGAGTSVLRGAPQWDELRLPASCAVVVMGEGSARRTEKAPGYLDPRAGEHDRQLAAALGAGEGYRLNEGVRDEDDLLIAGVEARDALAHAVEPFAWDAELLYDDAPFGVGYLVAVWTARA